MQRIKTRVLAFVDILGFKNTVKKWLQDRTVADKVERAWKSAAAWVGGKRALNTTRLEDWRLRVFSDCACISQPSGELGVLNLLEGAAFFQREMICAGFVIRGGISLGLHYETKYSLLSEALLDAHELESRHANTPRIVVSSRLIHEIDMIEDDEVRKDIKQYITIDADGIPFLCYMIFETEDEWCGGHQFYENQRDLVSSMITERSCPPEVRDKYEWIAQYHNWCVRETAHLLKCSGIMTEDDVWSFPSLMVKAASNQREFRSALWLDRAFHGHDVKRRNEIDWVKQWPGEVTEDDEPEDHV